MQTLYADVLFFVNFCMDFLSLWLVGSLLHQKRRPLPLLLSAALGAGYALLETLYGGHPFFSFLIFLGVGATMILLAYGGASLTRLFRLYLAFLLTSVLLGGMVTVFYSALASYVGLDALPLRKSDILLTLGALSGILILAAKRFFFRTRAGKTATLSLAVGERTLTLSALFDSGNLLTDPITGLPVILLRASVAKRLLPDGYRLPTASVPRLDARPPHMHPVFIESVAGREMMWAFTPDALHLCGAHTPRAFRAAVAIDMRDKPYGECDALAPTLILE